MEPQSPPPNLKTADTMSNEDRLIIAASDLKIQMAQKDMELAKMQFELARTRHALIQTNAAAEQKPVQDKYGIGPEDQVDTTSGKIIRKAPASPPAPETAPAAPTNGATSASAPAPAAEPPAPAPAPAPAG